MISAENEASMRLERNVDITYGVSQGLCGELVNNSRRHSIATSALDQPAPPVTAIAVSLFLPCRRLFKSIVKGLKISTIQDAHLVEKV
jgi:hypothetical protein